MLVELFAVADVEVPYGTPRPPTRSLATVDMQAAGMLAALDRHF